MQSDNGVACFVMPCRNPIFLAKQTATVDHLTNGRLLVEGPVLVTTAFGAVAVEDGAGVIELGRDALEVACTRGALRLDDAAGEEELHAGAHAVRTRARAAAR